MSKIILDTNVLYGLAVTNDAHHEKSKKLFSQLSGENEILIPEIVVAELLASGDSFDFVNFCENLSSDWLSLQKSDFDFIASLPSKVRRTLKANDCIILAMCKKFNAELITFDRKLMRYYKKLRIKD